MANPAAWSETAFLHGVGRVHWRQMSSLLAALQDHPVRVFAAGENVLTEGESTGRLYFLISGTVEVVKDGVGVARSSEPGAVFGDLSALLNGAHTATVTASTEAAFHVVEDPRGFLGRNPLVCLHLCELLARRLDAVNRYLVDVRRQFAEQEGHLGMVDGVLDTLMHRQPRRRVPPKSSTLRDPEVAD